MTNTEVLVLDYLENRDWIIWNHEELSVEELEQMSPSAFRGLEKVIKPLRTALVNSEDVSARTHDRIISTDGTKEAWAEKDGQPLSSGWKLKPSPPIPEVPGQLSFLSGEVA